MAHQESFLGRAPVVLVLSRALQVIPPPAWAPSTSLENIKHFRERYGGNVNDHVKVARATSIFLSNGCILFWL